MKDTSIKKRVYAKVFKFQSEDKMRFFVKKGEYDRVLCELKQLQDLKKRFQF